MKVLITGATGFVGSRLTQRLVNEAFEVGIVKRRNSNVWRIKNLLDKIKTYDVDIRDIKCVYGAISHFKPDVIFHLATYYVIDHQPQELPLLIDTNVSGTMNLLEASREFMVKLFVNTSSCFVYKNNKDKLSESMELNPLNLYALTKILAEQTCTFYAEKYDLKIITFRLFPPYGPYDHERRLIPYTITSLIEGKEPKMTTGEQRWDFVYIDDIVNAYLKALSVHKLPIKHEIFNIGTGNAVSIRKIVSRIKEIIGTELEPDWGAIPHRVNELWYTCADTSKAERILKWKPKIQILTDGLQFTVEWYKNIWGGKKRE